ncbi:MAG TPA: hypothetical protein VGV90_13985 [Solirubrobacteraceae bacterium]|nr:hypothetical protein [Solirubrobacteraceae bacterium]
MSIKDKVSGFVKSLTSDKANEDTPADVDAPDPDEGAVDMQAERAPMAGFEPEPDAKSG